MSTPLKNQTATISTIAKTKGLSKDTRDKTVHLYWEEQIYNRQAAWWEVINCSNVQLLEKQ